MKVRTGFVSNSSSSSYCIIGGNLSNDETLLEYFKLTEEAENCKSYEINETLSNLLKEFYEPLGFLVDYSSDAEYFLIGLDLTDTKNHEKPIKQMLAEVTALFAAVPNEIKPSHVSLDCDVIYT